MVFDLFETLVTEGPVRIAGERTGASSWQTEAAGALGVPVSVFQEVWRGLKDDRLSSVVPFEDVLRRVCTEAGVAADDQIISRLDRRRRSAKASCFAAIDERVLDTLDCLSEQGVPVAILSNCSGEEVDALAASQIGRRIKHRLLSCEIGYRKPEPEAYHLACDRLGVGPSECFFVGDGSFDELAGARQAGLHPIWARWFMGGWPRPVARRHDALIAPQAFVTAESPSDVIAAVHARRQQVTIGVASTMPTDNKG